MATITSAASGNWGTAGTWIGGVVPANGDTVIIDTGHRIKFDVDQSGFAAGLAALTINGTLHFTRSGNTCLKMNGNITGTGNLFVGFIDPANGLSWSLVSGKINTYSANLGFSAAAFFETDSGLPFTLVEDINSVEELHSSYYPDGNTIYVNMSDGANPNTHTNCLAVRQIDRPAAGSEYKAYILFNSTGTINIPTIRMYGWYPEREYTTLVANAASGQNQIVLTHDMGFQAGDIIIIGSGTEYGTTAEAAAGKYTVSSYDVGTKTVTLSANLQTNRLSGDYVAQWSRPIKIARTSGTATFCTRDAASETEKYVLVGVFPYNCHFFIPANSTYFRTVEIDHCTSNKYLVYGGKVIYTNSVTSYLPHLYTTPDSIETDNIAINTSVQGYVQHVIKRVVCQNGSTSSYSSGLVMFEDSIIKNGSWGAWSNQGRFKNCIFENMHKHSQRITGDVIAIDCEFKNESSVGGHALDNTVGKLVNCLFSGDLEVNLTKNSIVGYKSLESFEHDQITGNYKAWMKGGTIETVEDGEGNIIPRKLKFNCESVDYPVFRDYNKKMAANSHLYLIIPSYKSASGVTLKIQIIDPNDDPLIDETAVPLKEKSLTTTSAYKDILIHFENNINYSRDVIIRLLAQGSTGYGLFKTSSLERRL